MLSDKAERRGIDLALCHRILAALDHQASIGMLGWLKGQLYNVSDESQLDEAAVGSQNQQLRNMQIAQCNFADGDGVHFGPAGGQPPMPLMLRDMSLMLLDELMCAGR